MKIRNFKNCELKTKNCKLRFGILAHPAGHSLSPAMHRAAFAEFGIDAKYDFFDVPPGKLAEFFEKEVRTKNISGLSVSIPHKIEVMKFLDEIEDSAKKIGAVNTIFWKNEKLVGTNTDWLGFLNAFDEPIENKSAVVLGGGGAARALVFALREKNCPTTVITREEWEFAEIKKDFGVATDFISNLDKYSPEILVNATPLGMSGAFENLSFVPSEFFEKCRPLVFDIVYNPRETKLLADARAAGCATIEGLEMLVRQGAAQFEIWLGEKPNLDTMFAAVREKLAK